MTLIAPTETGGPRNTPGRGRSTTRGRASLWAFAVLTTLVVAVAGCGSNFPLGPSALLHSIEYQVTGVDVSRVSLIYETNTVQRQTGSSTLPWSRERIVRSFEPLYLSAQITEGDGSITVRIIRDGAVIRSVSVSGLAAIATVTALS